MVIYQGKFRPWDNMFSNKLEMFNEAMCGIILYHLMLFTDFYDNFEVRYFLVGNSMIYTTFVAIGINSMVIISKFVVQMIRSYKKRQALKRYWRQKKFLQEQVDHANELKRRNPPTVESISKPNRIRQMVEER